ncbi:MAG: response regulator transcription factor [Anaerolineae bacterium]|nr:response regulator transcription factor [Anaerolineae bacterium]
MPNEADNKQIRIVLAEDHHVVRNAIAALLANEADMAIVGEVADGRTLLSTVARLQPDILLMDAQMPNHKPVTAVEQLREQYPQVRVLVLSAFNLPEYVVGLLKAGANGYVLKDDPTKLLLHAIRIVANGGEWVSPRTTSILIEAMRSESSDLEAKLTVRELDVIRLMARGRRNEEIAAELVVTNQTVKNHVTNIFRKLDVSTRVEAVLYALSAGLVSIKTINEEY